MHRDRSSDHPGVFDPEVVDPLVAALGPLCDRMWPASFHGIERLPEHDRFMVVANHSGMGSAELWALLAAWHRGLGGGRKVAGMAHPGAFRVPILGRVLRGLGAVEATREGAAKARRSGAPLLVFPGGDIEAARPFWQADRVSFAGRKGWIRLAREHGLAIVPMCITGSHKTLPVIASGRAMAWLLGLRFIGVHRAPLTVLSAAAAAGAFRLARGAGVGRAGSALAAWASASLAMMIPWLPSAIGFHVLPVISRDELVDPAMDDAVYTRVTGDLDKTLRARSERAARAAKEPR